MPNSRTPRIIGRVLKITMGLLVLSVCLILLFRICSSGDPKSVDVLIPNEELCRLYEEKGDKVLLRYQNQPSITRGEHNSGYFSVTQYVFIPEADQVQLVFRYNNSTLEHLQKDYHLKQLPKKSAHVFDVSLVLVETDPNDPEKTVKVRYAPVEEYTVKDTESKGLYTYYRYVFEGIDVTDKTVGVFVDVYYVGDIDYEKDAYGRLCLYDTEHKWITQKWTSADKKAMEAWIEKRK